MTVWLYVLIHDRPEELRQCLHSITKYPAGATYRTAVYMDAPDKDTIKEATDFVSNADIVLTSEQNVGAARAMNSLLMTREDSDHVLRLDSDTKWRSNNWLATLERDLGAFGVIAPAYKTEAEQPQYVDHECPPAGATLYRADVLNALGRFHVYGTYGCEDLDYNLRAKQAGFRVGINREVRVKTAPTTAHERKEILERSLVEFKKMEQKYLNGLEIHQ